MTRWLRFIRDAQWYTKAAWLLAVGFGLLLIPDGRRPPPKGAGQQAFRWDRDAFWAELEKEFQQARKLEGAALKQSIDEALVRINAEIREVASAAAGGNLKPDAAVFESLETNFFHLAPKVAAGSERLPEFLAAYTGMREAIKDVSTQWPVNEAARGRLYRSLYGGRAALEEAMLQSPREGLRPLLVGSAGAVDPTAAMFDGIAIRSGDILLSRGGAATSALIARGNDYPGNFSHVALVHVDGQTKQISVIEAHIELGVKVASFERYLKDKKLRLLLLRHRSADGGRIADAAWQQVQQGHIPYDFAMDHADAGKQFCSEVASAAYAAQGIKLWPLLSRISAPGVTAWLSALGVENFESQEPADLEYDPQLRVIAEWRDFDTLFKDHVDNAVIDVMLEGADRGDQLTYHFWALPFVRLAKGYSVVKNWFGGVGPVPEGMSATVALRVEGLRKRHAALVTAVMTGAERFKAERGYVPPYWELVRLAREAQSKS